MIYGIHTKFLSSRLCLLEEAIASFNKCLGYKIKESDFSEALSAFRNYYTSRPIAHPGDHEMYNIMSHYAAMGATEDDCKLIIIKQFK